MTTRIAVHDFSGHAFPVQLSRELARRGFDILHLHCPSYVSGKGSLDPKPGDPHSFALEPVGLKNTFEKYSPLRRVAQERDYGRRVVQRLREFSPSVVLSGNTPLFSQRLILQYCSSASIRFVFWQQDIYSFGMQSAVAKLPLVGGALGRAFVGLERRMLEQSTDVVAISSDFLPTLAQWNIPSERIHVIQNWAPLDELPQLARRNRWSEEHGLTDKVVLLYSGTLGRKHDPSLILELANRFRDQPHVMVVVASEGAGSDWLRDRVREHALENVKLVGFQPYERLPELLATGDILVVVLEEDAGVFSVPSKMLAYQCAGRPLLACLPPENLAGRIIRECGCGLVASPRNREKFLANAEELVDHPSLRHELSQNARRYATKTFDIASITDRFEAILVGAAALGPNGR